MPKWMNFSFWKRSMEEVHQDLRILYWERNLSLREMAKEVPADLRTIGKYMEKLGIPRRTRKEAAQLLGKKPDFKEKMRIINKGRTSWKKGLTEEDPRALKNNEKIRISTKKPECRLKHRLMRLQQVFPLKDTSIEQKVQQELRRKGVVFETHYPIIGQPDIAFPREQIAVFLDGCFWHCCPICFPWRKSDGSDVRVTEELQRRGWLVLRYWEHDINKSVDSVVDDILLYKVRCMRDFTKYSIKEVL